MFIIVKEFELMCISPFTSSNKEINGNWWFFLQQWIDNYRKAYSVGYIESNWYPSKMNGIDLYLFWKDLTSVPFNWTCVSLHGIELISTAIYWNRFQFRSEWSWFLFPVNRAVIYPDSKELISIPSELNWYTLIQWSWYLPWFNGAALYS